MKTITVAAVLMMLAASAWADSGARSDANETATTDEPIVLSDAEMDEVSAGYRAIYFSVDKAIGWVGWFGVIIDVD